MVFLHNWRNTASIKNAAHVFIIKHINLILQALSFKGVHLAMPVLFCNWNPYGCSRTIRLGLLWPSSDALKNNVASLLISTSMVVFPVSWGDSFSNKYSSYMVDLNSIFESSLMHVWRESLYFHWLKEVFQNAIFRYEQF